MAGIAARKIIVAFDCTDALELAEFYALMLGWRVRTHDGHPQWVEVLPPEGEPAGFALACQTVPDFRAPT